MTEFIEFKGAGWHNLYPVYFGRDLTDNSIIVFPRGFQRTYNFWSWLTSDVLGLDYIFDTAELVVPFYIRRSDVENFCSNYFD